MAVRQQRGVAASAFMNMQHEIEVNDQRAALSRSGGDHTSAVFAYRRDPGVGYFVFVAGSWRHLVGLRGPRRRVSSRLVASNR